MSVRNFGPILILILIGTSSTSAFDPPDAASLQMDKYVVTYATSEPLPSLSESHATVADEQALALIRREAYEVGLAQGNDSAEYQSLRHQEVALSAVIEENQQYATRTVVRSSSALINETLPEIQTALLAEGVPILYASPIESSVVVIASEEQVERIREHNLVLDVQPVSGVMVPDTNWSHKVLRADLVQQYVDGYPIKVAVLDTGVDPNQQNINRVDWGTCGGTVLEDSHGTRVAGVVGNEKVGYHGMAPEVTIADVRISLQTGEIDYDTLKCGLDRVSYTHNAEAQAIQKSSSKKLGQGSDDPNDWLQFRSMQDRFVDRFDYFLSVSAGNDGVRVWPTSDGYNVVSAGAFNDADTLTFSDDSLWTGSNHGLSYDGRRKPDFSAPGVSIVAPTKCSSGPCDDVATSTGTSHSSPHLAGLAALLEDRAPDSTNDLKRAIIAATTWRMRADYQWDTQYGWGKPHSMRAYSSFDKGSYWTGTVTSGQTVSLPVTLSAAQEFQVALVWKRHLYSVSSYKPMSDLDVRVDGPGGNAWISSSAVDSTEGFGFCAPLAGTYTISVLAPTVPAEVSPQYFALAYDKRGAC